MGAVEVAADRAEPGRPRIVALKRLLSDVAKDKRHVEAFLREARLALLLAHPNVVRAHWVGEQDGQVMLAMDYVEGESLADVLCSGPLSPSLAAFVIAEVCAGLHAAHELVDVGGKALNLVHRDISPHNVMIGYDGRVLVLDFGVAKIDSGAGLTRTGEVKGKAAYMSPEQGLGDPIDRRSDLYAVGAVLYECVAGKRMWAGETDMAVLKQLALSEPPKLEGAGIPAAMTEIAAKLVSRDRDARPKSAAEAEAVLRPLAGSSRALAARMEELFADQQKDKRDRLEAALEAREPDEAEALRASLLPVEAGTKPAAPSAIASPPRRFWLLWAALLAVVAIPAALYLTHKPAPMPAAPLIPEPSSTPAIEPSKTAAPPETTAVAPAPTRATAVPTIRARPSVSALPSMSGSRRTPDVDPHPF
jgi:serine/threonine-protein kinase